MNEIIARDLVGNEFIVSAQAELSTELNGNQSLQLTVTPNKVNDTFIDDIDAMWEIDYYGNTYKVVYTNKKTRGHGFYVDVRAVHHALDKLDSLRVYSRYDGSLTDYNAFTRVFTPETGYSFELLSSFNAIQIEGFGDGDTNLECFKRLLDRFGAEFYISGKTFYIDKYIGRDTNFEYRYKLNASDVSEETDGASTFTYVKGFGDYEENEENIQDNAKIKREYESPLSKILGRRHAPMVAKGSYKTTSAIDKAMKEVVDNSISISVEADVKDLRKQGYPYAQPELGDRVFLNDKRIGFNQEVRVVDIKIKRYANGTVRNINLTFGNERVKKSYASRLSSAMANLDKLLNGGMELSFDVLDQRSKDMLRKIMSVDSELKLDNGIFAVDKNNPNNVVGLNSAGWFISKDGGKTAKVVATSDGIVANVINTGTMYANRIAGGSLASTSGSMVWNLDKNEFNYYTGATTHYWGSSSIQFHTMMNTMFAEMNGTTAFLNFMTSMDAEYPTVVLGASEDGATGGTSSFVGFKAQSAKATPLGYSQAEILGDRIVFDGHGGEETTGTWIMETYRKQGDKTRALYGKDVDIGYKYELGDISSRFENIWVKKLSDGIRVVRDENTGNGSLFSRDLRNGVTFSNSGLSFTWGGKSYSFGWVLEEFERLNGSLASVNKRVDSSNSMINGVSARADSINKRIDGVGDQIKTTNERIEEVNKRIDVILETSGGN